MAAATSKSPHRSTSLPCSSHPLISQFDEHMRRLRASQSQATSTAPSSLSTSHKLNGLQDLHDCVDKLLLLPQARQALAQEQNREWVDELLDGSLRLLDVCNTAKEALLLTKECSRELQSTIRRKQGGESGLTNEVRKFLTSRKMSKKSIQKALKNLKGSESRSTCSPVDDDNEIATIVNVLREAETATLDVLKSLLTFISGPDAKGKTSNWSLVSKIMLHKKIACEEEEANENEFALANEALESLVAWKTSKYENVKLVENVQNHLKNLEGCIQDLEEGTQCLFRRMIKTRVTLLNIFN